MSNIKILPENICNRIAAGEVIERPASIVKELVENSIDAKATKITVNIEKAGSKLISVTDNGCGMDEDDALLCLEQHATSKIRNTKDIEEIISFGFRGEAIPSIASVTRFTLRTRTQDMIDGTEIIMQGGKLIKSSPVGCAPGTEIIVKDLFFNTPARKKFLKAPATEERHIQETMYLLATPHTEISFELIMNKRTVFSSPAHHDVKPRLTTFYGKSIVDKMLPVAYKEAGITVNGFIAKHGITKPGRREQRCFVNGRAVESPAIFRGIKEAYSNITEKGRFPPVILFIAIDACMVDVNVHPAKREVRFRNAQILSSVITKAIRIILQTSNRPTISIDDSVPLKSKLNAANVNYSFKSKEQTPQLNFKPSVSIENNLKDTAQSDDQFNNNQSALHNNIEVTEQTQETESNINQITQYNNNNVQKVEFEKPKTPLSFLDSDKIEILGVLQDSYIIIKTDSGMVVIDQHAAHERVLFEQILNNNSNDVITQKLLFPITLDLSPIETRFLEKHTSDFANLGFDIEDFGNNTMIVTAIPTAIKQENVGGLIAEILENILTKGDASRKADKNMIAQTACKAAVKANDKLSELEIKGLLKQMGECEFPFSCPHGRPTIIKIGIKELEKRFGRI